MSIYELVFTDHGRLVISGLFGSAVAAALDYGGIPATIRRLIVGAISAVFLHELAVPVTKLFLGLLGAPEEPSIALSGFLMGVVGVSFIEGLLLASHTFRDKFKK